jgi:peroxiredoxin
MKLRYFCRMKSLIFSLILLTYFNIAFTQTKLVKSKNLVDSLSESKSMPPFEFYNILDSATFTPQNLIKSQKTLFIYFNTNCDHCQQETEDLKKYMDYFEGVQIIMVSRQTRNEILAFYEKYQLFNYPITCLMDSQQKIHEWFQFDYIPMIRQYDKNRQLIAAYNEQATVFELYENFK